MYRSGRFSSLLGSKGILPENDGSKPIAAAGATWFAHIGHVVAADDSIRIHSPITCADGSHKGIETGNSGRDEAPSQLYLGHENCGQGLKRRIGRSKANGEVVEMEHGDRDKPGLPVSAVQKGGRYIIKDRSLR